MEPLNARFGGGAAETALHPIVLGLLILVTLFIIAGRIKYLFIPFMVTVLLVPLGQVLVVGGMHFTVMRIVILLGLVRCAISKRWRLAGGFNSVDKAFLLWSFAYVVAFTLLNMEAQALINRLGFLVDAVGGYVLLRLTIRSIEDSKQVLRLLILMSMAISLCMINEHITHKNMFASLGGLNATPDIRAGAVRSQGPFQHSILAGTFGATSLPLFAGLWRLRRLRREAVIGVLSATAMVVTASGSTPVLAYLAAIVGLISWPFRRWMRQLRWIVISSLIGLHVLMKAPVWALISRLDLTGSSSSDHRYELVDNFIRHFGEWWMIGTKSYDKWGFDMWDTSNQYVEYGVHGGLITLMAFVAIIWLSFALLYRTLQNPSNREREWLLWCLCVSLVAHTIAFFGISYFDQMQFIWYALLAMISASTITPLKVSVLPLSSVGKRTPESYLAPQNGTAW